VIGHARAAAAPTPRWIRILTAVVIGDAAIAAPVSRRIGADAGVVVGHALMPAASIARTIRSRAGIVVA